MLRWPIFWDRHVYPPEPHGLSQFSDCPQAKLASEAEAMVLGQRRATVETTLRETQEENDEFRRRILGLEQQLKEARGLAEGGEAAEARLRDKVRRLEVSTPTSTIPSSLFQYSAIGFSVPARPALPSQCAAFMGCSFALTIPVKLGFFFLERLGVNVSDFALIFLSPAFLPFACSLFCAFLLIP